MLERLIFIFIERSHIRIGKFIYAFDINRCGVEHNRNQLLRITVDGGAKEAVYQMLDDTAAEVVQSPEKFKGYLDVQSRMDRYTANNASLAAFPTSSSPIFLKCPFAF